MREIYILSFDGCVWAFYTCKKYMASPIPTIKSSICDGTNSCL